jgi:hypothetical protein
LFLLRGDQTFVVVAMLIIGWLLTVVVQTGSVKETVGRQDSGETVDQNRPAPTPR